MREKKSINYTPPMIEVYMIELEEGIAAGSAIVKPQNLNNQVIEEWEVDPDDSRIIQF